MNIFKKMFLTVIVLISSVKLLLMPAYYSTDFEVHRNWLAITHSLPVQKWYYENTSEWTLDYPPFFAWFEYLLSHAAKLFDPKMLDVNNLNYASSETVLFQRLSVIVTDFVLAYGTYRCSMALPKTWKCESLLPILIFGNVGLLIVDHIHFQYNGVMYGILLLSIALMFQKCYLSSALLFTFLVNMKHIYVYLGPAYFIYLLRNHCFKMGNVAGKVQKFSFIKSFSCKGFLQLGSVVTAIFAVSLGPFYNQLGQLFLRLFPFKRGLCHAYWAPNVWALYNTVDKIAAPAALRLGYGHAVTNATASMTGGLVQESSHSFLPNVTPRVTMILTVIVMLPCLWKLWKLGEKPMNFVRSLVVCALSSFLFGWHVHEKAILMAILPLSLPATVDSFDARIFLILSTVGHYSLFPLLFHNNLLLIKLLLLTIYAIYAFRNLPKMYPFKFCKCTLPLLNVPESLYLLGLLPLFLYENFVHSLIGLDVRLPFLPLMMTSDYCSLGVLYCWLAYYVNFMRRRT